MFKSVLLFSLLTPLFAAKGEPTWDLAFSRGVAALDQGHQQDALPQLTAALEQARKFVPNDIRTVKSAYVLGLAYQLQGDAGQAEPLFLEAKKMIDTIGPDARPVLGYVLQGLGQLRFDQGRWKEAEPLLRQAIVECRDNMGPEHSSTLAAERHLGELLAAEGSTGEAQSIFEHLIAILRQAQPAKVDFLAGTLSNFGALYVREERFDLAEPLLRESLELASQHKVSGPVLADTLLGLGEMYRLEHTLARAEPLLKKALSIYETNNDPHQAGALNELGLVALDEGKFAIAKTYIQQSLRIYERVAGPTHMLIASVKAALAQAFLGERNIAQARTLIGEALTTERRLAGDKHSDYARLLMIAGNVEEAGHRRSEAAAYYRQALEVYRESLAVGHPERIGAEQTYARFAKSLRN
jgi:tetratricopeptide (TPR) repeat protein